MSISKKDYYSLWEQLEGKDFLVEDGYIYFVSNNGWFDSICRVPIRKGTEYILNKRRRLVTEDKEIFNEYLEKKRQGIRGYKTITMGVIEDKYYLGIPEYSVLGTDIDGYYWMIDWNRDTVSIPYEIRQKMIEYLKGLESEFKKIS